MCAHVWTQSLEYIMWNDEPPNLQAEDASADQLGNMSATDNGHSLLSAHLSSH